MLLYAEQQGMIRASAQGMLFPYNPVSRVELTVMLARAYRLESSTENPFTDTDARSWYGPYIGVISKYHLFRLDDPKKLEPSKPVTMDEVNRALLLINTLKKYGVGPVRIDAPEPLLPAANPPSVYTVVSTRIQNVPLVRAPEIKRFPLVRRTPIKQPITVEERRMTIFNMVNVIRIREGLTPLAPSSQLEQSAQAYADRMATEGFFAHIAPDGQNVQQRIDATGFTDKSFVESCRCIPGYALAENLARGQKTAEEAVEDWMKSPEHKAALLNPVYTHTGIGLNAGIWVQHFGGVVLP